MAVCGRRNKNFVLIFNENDCASPDNRNVASSDQHLVIDEQGGGVQTASRRPVAGASQSICGLGGLGTHKSQFPHALVVLQIEIRTIRQTRRIRASRSRFSPSEQVSADTVHL